MNRKYDQNISSSKKISGTGRKLLMILILVALIFAVFILFTVTESRNSAIIRKIFPGKEVLKSDSFMRYEGPVLPIISREANKDSEIKVERKLLCDFYRVNAMVPTTKSVLLEDHYYIENTGREKRIKLIYPFVSNIIGMHYSYPKIIQYGEEIEPKLYYGDYTGDFVSTNNEVEEGETLNLRDYSCPNQYKKVLNDKKYLDDAKSCVPDTKNIPVTVFEFVNSYYSETSEAENPTLVAGIEIDRNKSAVLTLGFEGFAHFEGKSEFFQYSIPRKNTNSFTDDKHYLIVVGEGVEAVNIETQHTGGWDAYEKNSTTLRNNLKDAGASLYRREMSLAEALDLTLPILYENYKNNQRSREKDFYSWKLPNHNIQPYILSYEEFKELYIRELFRIGVMSKKAMLRYEDGSLENLDVINFARVIFAEFEINLPANKTTELLIGSYKKGSMDFFGDRYDRAVYGYDILTGIDSEIPLNKSEIEIIDHDKVNITEQNIGFDLAKGIRKITLARDRAYYWQLTAEK